MSKIKVVGSQFEIDGQRRPYLIQSWFKMMSWLRAPTLDMGKAHRACERIEELGFDGIRIFDEHHDWEGNTFLTHGAPLSKPYNLRQTTSSAFDLSGEQKVSYLRLLELLSQHDLIAELCINATIKTSPGYLGGKPDRTVRYWERMLRTVMQYVNQHDVEGRIIWENCNEFDAHISTDAYRFLRFDSNGVDLVPRMAERAEQDAPGRPFGISQGGEWEPIKYKAPPYTHANIHSTRHADWWNISDKINKAKAMFAGVPLALNENMHGMSRAQWDYWVTQGHHPNPAKLANQSVPDTDVDVELMLRQYTAARDAEVSYCLHNANGIFSDPDLPLDGFELALAVKPPPARLKYETFVRDAYRKVLHRDADQGGLEHYNRVIETGEIQPTDLINILYRSKEYLGRPDLW